MVFRRQSLRLRPIHRIKHVVDVQNGLTAGTVATENIINAKDAPVLANTIEVETGSKVYSIFLIVEVLATSSAGLPNCYLTVAKNPGGNLTLPAPNVVGASDNKRFVIHQEMVMLQGQSGSNPRTLFKGVIKIPGDYSRFGPNDFLTLKILAPGVNLSYCLQVHYKEFR